MTALPLILLLAAADPGDGLAKKMLPIYLKDAEGYSLAVESAPKKALELKKEPVFEWSDSAREGFTTQGVVFVWLRAGRPAAIGSIYSEPEERLKGRKVYHEFHALDAEKLLVTPPKGTLNEWKPEAGLVRKELLDAPAPADTAAARLLQMKKLAAEFTGHGIDQQKKRVDMRLLPTPLYRYPTAKTGVIDGALFTLVATAGTDPEILLLIEAKEEKGKVRWEFACGRFSDKSLYVQRKEKEVWALARGETNTWLRDPQHLFRVYPDRVVTLEGKVLARCRATETAWWGDYFPAEDK
ncbi:Uncharacterized protein OS=Planctomyces maris DSM 8797 GN=PM8797T_23941 PE=4 SV=1 [Gemmata massiliana]|uniref:Uncharacterized protein n=1 Tax=Gemmata massiliana TaxID=1210884 RepID=A0A6P2D7R7_9BACT|nr:hypothetical protein [Gemmata massiliana]VTR96174.1 Uncharacterized protein OS=Planctomyces maris DSM 8797 GN=PM8797T_23941 PE=4 SV=1 [Gemmata massiliana]